MYKRQVFAIHIPIAFSALTAPFLGIAPASLLILPLHVVLLEVLIDPTCSIVLERQPAERDLMERCPRSPKEKLLTPRLLTKSILQGLAVFAASFGSYLVILTGIPHNASLARSMGLTVIMLANLFLVLEGSSDQDSLFRSLHLLIKDRVMWAVNLGTLMLLGLILYTPLSAVLKLAALPLPLLLTAVVLAAASVLWYEPVKLIHRLHAQR